MKELLRHNKNILLIALFVAFATFLVYIPALDNGFVNWDDGTYVYENNDIRSLDLKFIKQTLTTPFFSNWHPITVFSYALDYAVWGVNPLGYHLTNIVLHTANTFLVFILAVRLIECGSMTNTTPQSPPLNKEGAKGRYPLIAASVTALLFGIHPLHVESVAWISERKDVLCAFFYVLSSLTYIKYASATSSKRPFHYGACLIFFIIALMSKPMAVSLPIIFLILDFYPLGRLSLLEDGLKWRKKSILIEKLPFLFLSILSSFITMWAYHSSRGLPGIDIIPIDIRIFVAARAYLFYLVKIILPFDIAPLYPLSVGIDPVDMEYLGSLTILLGITFWSIWSFKNVRLFSVVWFYYIFTLLPVIGLVQVGAYAAADRYTYLPSLALFLLLGIGAAYFYEKAKKLHKILITLVLIFMTGILAGKTVRQIGIWKDSITLWSYEIKVYPYATVAYLNRGSAKYHSGKYVQAIDDYKAAIELYPELTEAYYNIGSAYLAMGNPEIARIYDEKAASLRAKRR